MFTAGRILGRRAGSRAAERTSIFGDQWPGTSPADSRERRKFRCYVPFVWQSVLATVAGCVVMAAGVGLCIVGFYTGHQPQRPSEVREGSNDTEVSGAGYLAPVGGALGAASADSMTSQQHQQSLLTAMTYVGPVVMSLGCFALIFAFVLFCEARDHAVAYYIRSRLYASSSRGPRHSRLPFRRSVIDHILKVTKRRAERTASRRPAAVTAATDLDAREDATLIEPLNDTVNDELLKMDRRRPASSDVVTETERLLSNGMTQTTSLSPRPLSDSVHVNEQSAVTPTSEWSLGSCMPRAECAWDPTSASYRDRPEADGVCWKRPDAEEDQSVDLSLGGAVLRQSSSASDGRTSDGERDRVADFSRNETTVQDVAPAKERKSSESTPLMTADDLSDCEEAPQSGEPETASTMIDGQSHAESRKVSTLSSSSSSSSVLFDVRMFSEIASESNGYVERPLEGTDAANSSTASSPVVNRGPAADRDGRFSPTADSNDEDDGGKRPVTPHRTQSTERQTPSLTPAAGRADVGWRRGEGDRDHQDAVMRSHAGIHCPPPLPPPPASPAIVTASGRSPRRH